MRYFYGLLLVALTLICVPADSSAQVQGKNFGFGIIIGDPTGGTIKYWFNNQNALVVDLGASYFGSPRIQVDYLWHFDAFNSQVIKLYAGPGLAVGLGTGGNGWVYYRNGEGKRFYVRDDGGVGFGVRAVVGLNVIPRNTPLELFLEVGPMIGIAPAYGYAWDAAIGIRFYP